MSAEELAKEVKAEVVKLTGGWVSPKNMYIWTRTPDKKGRTVETHGFSGGECDVELVCEEAHDYIGRALENCIARKPEQYTGRFDEIQSCVLGFYDG